MGVSQFFEGVSKECRRHPVVQQQRRAGVISLPFKRLRILRLHHGSRCSRKQMADIADVKCPERSDSGTFQEKLQAVASVRMTLTFPKRAPTAATPAGFQKSGTIHSPIPKCINILTEPSDPGRLAAT